MEESGRHTRCDIDREVSQEIGRSSSDRADNEYDGKIQIGMNHTMIVNKNLEYSKSSFSMKPSFNLAPNLLPLSTASFMV